MRGWSQAGSTLFLSRDMSAPVPRKEAETISVDAKAVLVFAKPPRPGHVKTRLRSLLTAREAAEVHLACVKDTAAIVASVGGYRKWLLVAGRMGAAQKLAQQAALSTRWRLGVQVGRGLGERLEFAFGSHFLAGGQKVIVVGTDTPWMGPQRIVRAFQLLDATDVVIGPTEDGGYYLVGARRLVPEMFHGIRWGTADVFEQTVTALRKAKVSYRLLRRDFDLDRPEDLHHVARLLRRRKVRSPAVKRWIFHWELEPGHKPL